MEEWLDLQLREMAYERFDALLGKMVDEMYVWVEILRRETSDYIAQDVRDYTGRETAPLRWTFIGGGARMEGDGELILLAKDLVRDYSYQFNELYEEFEEEWESIFNREIYPLLAADDRNVFILQ